MKDGVFRVICLVLHPWSIQYFRNFLSQAAVLLKTLPHRYLQVADLPTELLTEEAVVHPCYSIKLLQKAQAKPSKFRYPQSGRVAAEPRGADR